MQLSIMILRISLSLLNFHHVYRITDPGGTLRGCTLTINYFHVEDISTTGVQHPSHRLSDLLETTTMKLFPKSTSLRTLAGSPTSGLRAEYSRSQYH